MKGGRAQVGCEALDQRDTTRAGPDDGDGGHINQPQTFRLCCLVE